MVPVDTFQLFAALQVAPSFLGKPVVRAIAPAPVSRRSHAVRASRGAAVVVEANIFSRLIRVVRAYVSNFTEQFEDPEVMLDRIMDEMQEDLLKMRQATAKVATATVTFLLSFHVSLLLVCMRACIHACGALLC